MDNPFRMDLRSLAAMRVALATTLLIDLAVRAEDLSAHYGVRGVYRCTSFAELKAPWHFDLFPCAAPGPWVEAHFALHAAFGVLLLLGLCTRLATLGSFVLLLSLHHRNPLVLNAGDTLLRLFTMWSLFLPLSARFSLDARLFKRRYAQPSLLSPATLALALQVLIIYPLVIQGRQGDTSWWQGSALAQIVDFDMFATRFGVALRELPVLLRYGNHGAMFWELWGPVLALLPVVGRGHLRTLTVLGFVALHLGIGAVVSVGTFPLVSAAGWMAFLPSGFWDTLGEKLRIAAREPRPLAHAWVRRAEWCFATGMASLMLLLSVGWHVQRKNLHPVPPELAAHVQRIGKGLELDQSWALFSTPPRNDGWFLMVGSLPDGRRLDIMRGGAPANFDKPRYVLENIPSRRWGKLLMRLRKKRYKEHRSRFIAHYAQAWNESAPCNRQIQRAELVFMAERGAGARKRVLWTYTPPVRAGCDVPRLPPLPKPRSTLVMGKLRGP